MTFLENVKLKNLFLNIEKNGLWVFKSSDTLFHTTLFHNKSERWFIDIGYCILKGVGLLGHYNTLLFLCLAHLRYVFRMQSDFSLSWNLSLLSQAGTFEIFMNLCSRETKIEAACNMKQLAVAMAIKHSVIWLGEP